MLKLIHIALSAALFFVFWMLFRYHALTGIDKYGFRYNYIVAAGYGALLYWFDRTYNAYILGYMRIRALVFGQFLSQLFTIVLVYLLVSVGWSHFRPPWIFLPMLALQLVLDIV